MKLPRDVKGEHHIAIPRHSTLKVGTLNGILRDIGEHLGKTKEQIIKELFRKKRGNQSQKSFSFHIHYLLHHGALQGSGGVVESVGELTEAEARKFCIKNVYNVQLKNFKQLNKLKELNKLRCLKS